jgi:hypothetical protein
MAEKLKVATTSLAGCFGCHMSFLDIDERLFPLLERIKKDSSLPAEQQLKLGSYFAQTVGSDRRFGQDLLAHLHKRHKGRIGDEVKLAMRAAGS